MPIARSTGVAEIGRSAYAEPTKHRNQTPRPNNQQSMRKNDSQTKSRLTQIKRLLWHFSCMLFVLEENCMKQKTAKHLLLVPRKGLEPPRCYSLVPETSASTNSATWAHLLIGAFA
jgi:hypothetical protein